MKNKYGNRLVTALIFFLFITGCSTTLTKTPTQEATDMPSSCEEVEGNCLELTFYGESCVYKGPEIVENGNATLILSNESEMPYKFNLIRLLEDKTYQDLIDYQGEEPSSKAAPSWLSFYPGVLDYVGPGQKYVWTGDLKSGIHALACVGRLGIWLGGEFTVVD